MTCPKSAMIFSTAILALTLVLGSVIAPATGQEVVYRWVDAQGMVHYGQVPPSGVEAERIMRTSPTSDRAAQDRLERAMQDQQQRQEQARSEDQARAQQETSDAIRREHCEKARNNLETLTSRGGRVTIRENDQYRVLEEEERQAMIEETRGQIREFCGE